MKVLTMYQSKPLKFFKDFFPKIEMLETFQSEIIQYFGAWKERDDTKSLVVITAGRGVGKSQLIAMIAIWFMCSFEEPIIRLVSSKMTQTRDVLFDTIKLLLNSSLLRNAYTATSLTVALKNGEGKPEKFQRISCQVVNERNPAGTGGDHREFQLLCIDEAQFLRKEQYLIITGIVATGRAFIIVSGNPSDNSNILYDLSHEENTKNKYKVLTVSGHDIQRSDYNLTAMIDHYGGINSVFYRMYVCGEWLESYDGRLFSLRDIERFVTTPILDFELDRNCVIGVDVAAGVGKDHTCIVARRDNHVKILEYDNYLQGDDLVDLLIGYCANGAVLAFDCEGVGNMLINNIKPHVKQFRKVRGSGRPRRTDQFKNIKAELYYTFADYLKNGDFGIRCGSQVQQLKNELKQITYEIVEGRVCMTEKRKINDSPDIADAIAYTFINGERTVKGDIQISFLDSISDMTRGGV